MIKTQDKDLIIYNTTTGKKNKIKGFNAPEAFIFLYDQEKILTLKDGKVQMWTSCGKMISDFGKMVLCSISGSPQNYVVSVSQSKKFLFSFMQMEPNVNDADPDHRAQAIRIQNMTEEQREKSLRDPNDPAYLFAPNAFINVINISREEVVARIKINGSKDYQKYYGFENTDLLREEEEQSTPKRQKLSEDFDDDDDHKAYVFNHEVNIHLEYEDKPKENKDQSHQDQKIFQNGKKNKYRRQFCTDHRISTMFYDEINHELFIGYSDGQIESFVPVHLGKT